MMNAHPPDRAFWRYVTAATIIVIDIAIVLVHPDWFLSGHLTLPFVIVILATCGGFALLCSSPSAVRQRRTRSFPARRTRGMFSQEAMYGVPPTYYGSAQRSGGCGVPVLILLVFVLLLALVYGWLMLLHGHFPILAAKELVGQAVSQTSAVKRSVVRINQLDPAQYASPQEYALWSPSTCSTASIAEVMNAYGRTLHLTDVLHAEEAAHAISPQKGLLDEDGIRRTVAAFGFQAVLSHSHPLDWVIATAQSGRPVVVSFPPQTWSGGHLLVVTGGDATTVQVVDSSAFAYTHFSRAQFLSFWRGFTALVTPTGGA